MALSILPKDNGGKVNGSKIKGLDRYETESTIATRKRARG
jgi:hypothetical protein